MPRSVSRSEVCCDDGNKVDTDACLKTCVAASCGDGFVRAGVETCDDAGESASCDGDCTPAMCGDGVVNMTAQEACDGMGESMTCDADCTPAMCGDGKLNKTAGEACDDGNAVDTDACLTDCKAAKCGDGVVQAGVEACDDGNMIDDDACSNTCEVNQANCLNGAVELTVAPGGTMKVCDHPNDSVCEENLEMVCPANWHLCSFKEFNARNAGWNHVVGNGSPIPHVVAEIYCRMNGSAGHFTVYNGTNLGTDMTLNCYTGSSRPDTCAGPYGCNNLSSHALCCSQNPKCGNGVVDDPEEECDDGNKLENDACLNSCSWRVPSAHGIGGCVN
ncbi:DUF4215 domain-containing protein [Nannocystis pusilla]|uniref:DUF4215 domain-containing protein n=1 Tax=Nannocystis pusilla TaxID=889268 RepID=A0A9X3ER16_9BACT|nr:DUF4215 domain-containing protein [Nannocystis pusilla]MCY1008558.1 DUF4215 domain-containing protein [Nannocystis pusilla]